jgi:exodeoxyribonuclease VII large subunit
VQQLEQRLRRILSNGLQQRQQVLNQWLQRLERQRPERRLQQQAQRLDELEQRLQRVISVRLRALQQQYAHCQMRLVNQSPKQRLLHDQQRQQLLAQRLQQALQRVLTAKHQQLAKQAQALHNLSPLQILQRGYAVVRKPGGQVVRQAAEVQTGDRIEALLGQGRLICTVEQAEE